MAGGADSAPHRYVILREDGSTRELRTKEVEVPIAPGERLHLLSAGGGGWGAPAARDAAAIATDKREGYVS